ncbi:spore germination protein [Alkaliphilus pronyensis]|uniref:Spore germination protein n=1 Tax=Alkaliphilus pronyensis TaxID=1482732 RepID=A0A6I0FB03_9FIRM|nr:spore germination protein [Alkaliphilus pronyensis]KAB3534855.1 spore germination protein [Alkaliphilus pronyensis]
MSKLFRNNKKKLKEIDESKNTNMFSKDFVENIDYIKNKLSKCCDVEYRPIKIINGLGINAYIFLINGMVDPTFVSENILKPLIKFEFEKDEVASIHEGVYNHLLTVGSVDIEKDLDSLVMKIISGGIGILIENESVAFSVEAIGWKERAVEETASETVIKGMKAGFVENIRTNTSLVRRMIKNPKLKIEKITKGRITNTEINIAYIEGVVLEDLLEEVRQRIERVDIDGIINLGMLQEMIDDSTFSLFSTSYTTERPDRACSCLLEGRVVVLMDNSPFVLIAPSVITQFIQSAEDYSTKYLTASFARILRVVALNINLLLPGLYVAIFSYHHEMIPNKLLKAVADAREKLPFPIFLEMFMLVFAFEILREAGVRLPRAVGQAVSIVGALVIGQAAVSAKLVSPPSIIVVALTAICSFTIPITEATNAYRLLTFIVLFAGGILGIPGIIAVSLIILVNISQLRSFGVPYLSPISPLSLSDWKDFIIRVPIQFMKKRPTQTAKSNKIRQRWWKGSDKK